MKLSHEDILSLKDRVTDRVRGFEDLNAGAKHAMDVQRSSVRQARQNAALVAKITAPARRLQRIAAEPQRSQ